MSVFTRVGGFGFGGGAAKPDGNPSGLTATVLSDTSIKLDWVNGATNQTGTRIYGRVQGVGSFVEFGIALGNLTTKLVEGLTENTTYEFYVKHYKGSKESEFDSAVSATTMFNLEELLADTYTAARYDATLSEGVELDSSLNDKIYWDLMTGKDGRSAEISSGNLIKYAVYEIIATQADFFYAGCAIGDIFPCEIVKTCDDNNKVKRVLGNHLVSLGLTTRPTSRIFDGSNDYMKSAPFTLVKPTTIYIIFRQIATTGETIFDGNVNYQGMLDQDATLTGLKIYEGSAYSPVDTNLPLNKYGIVRVLFNGASSSFQVDDNDIVVAGAIGTGNMGGFTIGARGAADALYGNIEFISAIVRNSDDSSELISKIMPWLRYKRDMLNNVWLASNLAYKQDQYHIMAQRGDKILASNTSNKLFYSANNGLTYTELAFADANKTQMGYIFENGNLLITTSLGVWKSTDNLATVVAITPLDDNGNPYITTVADTDAYLPLHIVKSQAVTAGEMIVFGTYGGKANVWASINGEDMKMVYRFGASYEYDALHIHSLEYNSSNNKWYCCTGDLAGKIHWMSGSYNEISGLLELTLLINGAVDNQLKSTSINVFENKLWWGSDQTSGHDYQGVWSSEIDTFTNVATHVQEFVWDQEIISVLVETDRIVFTAIEWNTVDTKWNIYVFDRVTKEIVQRRIQLTPNPPASEAAKYSLWLSHIQKVREGEYMMEIFTQLLYKTVRFYL